MAPVSGLSADLKVRIEALCQRGMEREAEAQRLHQERMATLPVGTCERCYGTKRAPGPYFGEVPCPECDPPLLHADGVPLEFRTSRLVNYVEQSGNQTAITKAKQFLQGGRDLYLTGGVGAGKTRLACAIANEWFFHRKAAFFVRVPMVLHQLQPGRDSGEAMHLEQGLFTTSLVVLDDLGAERDQATDYTRRTLLMIYEERGDRGLRTIFTSNKSVQELAEMQDDDRLASRIAGRADVVKLLTSDQRLTRRRATDR